jgi:transcription elongation factor GreA
MSHELIAKIEQMLHEEKWTRTAISAYTVTLIKELDALLAQIVESGIQNEVKELCDQHLIESKNSIIALYLSGFISLERQLLDDTNLVKLVNLFAQNIKWQIVEHIGLQMLNFGENKFALRSLLDCYKNEALDDKFLEIEERLIKVDIEEADIVYNLAQKFEKEKNIEKAVDYYKKGIHRYIHKKNFNRIREIWLKLLEFAPQESEYFHQVESKVAKNLGLEKAGQLLEDLYPVFVRAKDWDQAIDVQLRLNEYEPKSPQIRREIVECVRKKYENNPKTDEYVRLSNLNDSWKNLTDALEDFKKQIAYEKGNFVFHKAWGVGRIREVKDQEYVIDFETKRNQLMGQKMAVEALQSLARDDIRVIIATTKREDLAKRLKTEIDWGLKTILHSFGNKADMKMIKAILVPKVLEEREWTSWGTAARNHMKESQDFAISPDHQDEYLLRTQPISLDEKLFNKFKAEKDFFKRIDVVEEFIEKVGYESDYFTEIFSVFTNVLKSTKVTEEVIASFLLIQKHAKAYPFLNPNSNKTFLEYYQQIDDVVALFKNLSNQKIRTVFLQQVRLWVPDWEQVFTRLYTISLSPVVIEDLLTANRPDLVVKLFEELIERHKDNRESVFEAAKILLSGDFPVITTKFNPEKLFITLIHDLDLTYRDVTNKKDVTDNKRLNKQIHNFLFKENRLLTFVDQASEESLKRIYSLVQDVRDLNPNIKLELKQKISTRFPSFHFNEVEAPKVVSSRKGILATLKMFNSKKKELQNILEVEVSKNSKEIASALALGDLKENAEYHAAKERQTILNANATNLTKELDSAIVLEQKDVDPSKISFGTTVLLKSIETGKEERYTILGPWESDPSNNIISYLSPFADRLLNAKVGDNLKFTINERLYQFNVLRIDVADF